MAGTRGVAGLLGIAAANNALQQPSPAALGSAAAAATLLSGRTAAGGAAPVGSCMDNVPLSDIYFLVDSTGEAKTASTAAASTHAAALPFGAGRTD
jgi:hypothetical protein